MDFFDKLGKVASQTYKTTTEKADKLAKETKIKMKINENKAKIEKIYNEIGEAVYRNHISVKKEENDEEIRISCEEIDNISKEIEQLNNELLSIRNQRECSNCHEKIDKTAKFCPKCGMEQSQEVVSEESNDVTATEIEEEKTNKEE